MLQPRLRNQHAIKRIAMMARQISRCFGMRSRHVEKFESSVSAGSHGTAVEVELADPALDADLPDGGCAHRDVVLAILDRDSRRGRKKRIAPLPPEKDIRVE